MNTAVAEVNPFEVQQTRPNGQGLARQESERAIEEVRAAMTIAKRFPRDQAHSYTRIMNACKRKALAEEALYAYPRGNQMVTGPSIRMAEMLAQNWGNLQFGIRELEQGNGCSEVEAFAWDIETNTRQVKVFRVPHERHTRKGVSRLTDPRDIYELVANQGARRLRACILGVIPGDIIDAAVAACEKTLASEGGDEPLEDRVRKMVSAFADLGITKGMIEDRLGHNLDATQPAEIVSLKKIYKSLKDGMAKPADFFDVPPASSEAAAEINAELDDGPKGPTFAEVAEALEKSKSKAALTKAAKLIAELDDDDQREELSRIRERRAQELGDKD